MSALADFLQQNILDADNLFAASWCGLPNNFKSFKMNINRQQQVDIKEKKIKNFQSSLMGQYEFKDDSVVCHKFPSIGSGVIIDRSDIEKLMLQPQVIYFSASLINRFS